MINIAVMLNGSGKYLDITQELYKHWTTLYDGVHFDFFVSTWEDEIDYTNWDWITKWERLKEEDCPYDLKNHPTGRHQPHYCYTFKKVNELRNSHDVVYDGVLQTRCDYLIPKNTIDKMLSNITQLRGGGDERINPQLSSRNIFSSSGTMIHNDVTDEGELQQDLWTQDYYFFGKPEVFDVFAGMFDYMYIDDKTKDTINPLMHVFQAEYLHLMGIYNSYLNTANGLLIRTQNRFVLPDTETKDKSGNVIRLGGWSKKHPSPFQLKKIINDRGVEWMYNDNGFKKTIDWFNRTPK